MERTLIAFQPNLGAQVSREKCFRSGRVTHRSLALIGVPSVILLIAITGRTWSAAEGVGAVSASVAVEACIHDVLSSGESRLLIGVHF